MAYAVLALLLAQAAAPPPISASPSRPYVASPPSYRTGPIPDEQSDPEEEPAYNISPEALGLRPRVQPTGVTIDNYDPRVEGERDPADAAYDAVILGGAAAAQSRQGPLDGKWLLRGAGGTPMFEFQLVDPGEGEAVDGAWRKLDAARRSGFVLVGRDGLRTIFRFFEEGASAPVAVTLEPAADGSWRGELARGDRTEPVTLRRP